MERQRAEARKAWAGSGEAATETVWFALRERLGATEFLGYETETRRRRRRRRSSRDGAEVGCARGRRDAAALVLNQTPFYGESGGQVGDVGADRRARASRVRVADTQKKLGDLFVHEVEVEEGDAASRHGARARGRSRRAARRSAPTIRRPICCTRRCARCSATMSRRRARWSRPTGCASTSPIPSRSPTRSSPRSRTSPIASCWRTRRSSPA